MRCSAENVRLFASQATEQLATMGGALIICFTLLGDILDLRTWSGQARLVMGTLLVMTPTVFFFIQRLFDAVYAARIRVFAWFRSKWYRIFRKK